jgi:hypothetical protein
VIANGTGSVVIDLADLSSIDSTGIAAGRRHQRLNASGRRMGGSAGDLTGERDIALVRREPFEGRS